jgi:hypothetical protein
MKRIKILKAGIVTNQAELADADVDAWLAKEIMNGSFGKPQREVDEGGLANEGKLPKDAIANRIVTDESGIQKIKYTLAPEYSIVQEDMSVEVAEKKRKSDEDALNDSIRQVSKKRFIEADFTKIKDADLKQILSDLRILISKWS